jgi:hypothetical protein
LEQPSAGVCTLQVTCDIKTKILTGMLHVSRFNTPHSVAG